MSQILLCFYSFSAGKLSIEVPLNLTIYLTNEQDYLPWISALHWIYKMSDLLSLTPVYGIYEVCVCVCCVCFVCVCVVCVCVHVCVRMRARMHVCAVCWGTYIRMYLCTVV